MIRRAFRLGLLLGVIGAVAFALTKLLGNQEHSAAAVATRPSEPWPRLSSDPAVAAPPISRAVPDPQAPRSSKAKPEAKTKAKAKKATTAWVEPSGGVCPTSHPVKAKLASKIFHLPGMLNYERTKPDRCYQDAPAAEADGLRPAKR